MTPRRLWALRGACAMTLVSLGLISWAVIHPVPLAVIAAMSLGQGLGTLGVVLYLVIVFRDLRPVLQAPRPPRAAQIDAAPAAEDAAADPTSDVVMDVEPAPDENGEPPQR